jgi:hypothetical protein
MDTDKQPDGRDNQDKDCGKRCQVFMAYLVYHSPRISTCSPNQKLLKSHGPRIFIELDIQHPTPLSWRLVSETDSASPLIF